MIPDNEQQPPATSADVEPVAMDATAAASPAAPPPAAAPAASVDLDAYFHMNQEDSHAGPSWLITFADTLSLLLTFFVMLFSMSTLDKTIWEDVKESYDSVFNQEQQTGGTGKPLNEAVPEVVRRKSINIDYLRRILQQQLATNNLSTAATVQMVDDRLVISLPSDFLFEVGDATLLADARAPLIVLGGILRNISNRIEVYGHTDPSPIRGGPFKSNWELSITRSQTLTQALREVGLRRPVAFMGLADGQYGVLSTDIPESDRYRLARRVDIVVYSYAD